MDAVVPEQRRRALGWVGVSYGVAFLAAAATVLALPDEDWAWRVLWADVAGTVAIFAFSVAFKNSSFYDAYWSVAPIAIALYWAFQPEAANGDAARTAMVIGLTTLWGVRLTWNWARGWTGLDHEDWRYVNIREATGAAYWPASFAGIHMVPTLLVFAGCLPMLAAFRASTPFGLLDVAAAALTAGAVWLEAESDNQLLRYKQTKPSRESFLSEGLWSRSRHPNYLGEILFWWGLALFGIAAEPGAWWALSGAVAITLLFRFVSLPLIDDRMKERRPAYANHMERVPSLLPWPGMRA